MQSIILKNGGNWRIGWMICAGAMLVSVIIAIMFVKDSPEVLGQEPDGGLPVNVSAAGNNTKKVVATTYDWTPNQAYRTASYWSISIGACATKFPFFFFVAHWILFMMGLKFDATICAFSMGIFTITGLVGRLVWGLLMDTIEARIAFISGLVLYLIACVLAISMVPGNLIMAYAAAALFGIAFVCMQTITANFYGRKAYPKLNGMIMLISGILCAPAALIGGKLFEINKNYTASFQLIIAIVVIGIIALFFAKMPKPENEK